MAKATKGVSELYDTIESFIQKVQDYVERIGIHLQPSTPPTPAVMRILLETLIQVLNFLGIVTKYCGLAVEKDSWLKKAKDVVSLRASKRRASNWDIRSDRAYRGLFPGDG